MSGKLKTTSKEAAFQAQFEPGTLPYVHQESKSSRFPKSQAVCPHGQLLRQKAQRFKFIVEAVKLPAENFFVVLLFLLQRGNLVDLSLYDSGWVNIEIVIRPGVGAKTALQ